MYVKDFDKWNPVKKKVEEDKKFGNFRSGEIRWCAIGVNIGSEIDGKGEEFLRPVIIIEKSAPDLYLVVPLTTKLKTSLGYRELKLNNKNVSVCIHQIRTISAQRLYSRIEKIGQTKVLEIKEEVKKYFNF